MTVMGGYVGKLLRVDLGSGKFWDEPLPEDTVLRSYVGCLGLGMRILADETTPHMRPTDADAPLIFMTGPLTGTEAPSSSNLTTLCINYSAPKFAGTGHSHGNWAAYRKFAGYDGIVLKGKAPKPVYVWIDDGKVELRDATKLWGKDTRETEYWIKEELGDHEWISVACIGPAGENQLAGAAVRRTARLQKVR